MEDIMMIVPEMMKAVMKNPGASAAESTNAAKEIHTLLEDHTKGRCFHCLLAQMSTSCRWCKPREAQALARKPVYEDPS